MTLRLGRHAFVDDATLMMAIVNRTPDSFYDQGATWAEDKAFERVAQVVEQGAEIVDIGGIKAAPGVDIDAAEERARVVDFVARVRAAYPSLVISVDTWRASVGAAACEAGADVLNDAWGGADPELVDAAAAHGAAIICTHTGGVTPRTRESASSTAFWRAVSGAVKPATPPSNCTSSATPSARAPPSVASSSASAAVRASGRCSRARET